MAVELYRPGYRHARDLIAAGKVDEDSSWSFTAADGDALLGDDEDWGRYASWHLGRETEADRETKAAWRYPFGKDGKVYRSAVRAIRSRAAQQGHDDIFEAAGRLLELMDARAEVNTDREVRMLDAAGLAVETREGGGEDEGPVLVGYAAVFDEETVINGWFREVIRRGAFRRAIEEEQDVRALWNHNPDYVLGRTRAGTLRLEEDERGLRVEIRPPRTTWATDLVESIRRGDVSQMSFAFRVRREAHDDGEDDRLPLREILDVDLYDVSPVTYPAYEATAISARSPAHVVRTWISDRIELASQEGREPEPEASGQELETLRLYLEIERLRHRDTA